MTVEADLTSISRGRSSERYIMAPVKIMEKSGVFVFLLTLAILSGRRPSLLSASGYLDADIIPALAVVINASDEAVIIDM